MVTIPKSAFVAYPPFPRDVTVCIPTIPPRRDKLTRALHSVLHQTHPASAVVIAQDVEKRGAAFTRHRALVGARTEWVAFLDDDDEIDSNHLAVLLNTAEEHGADYVWSRFRIGYPYSQPGALGQVRLKDGITFRDGPAPLGAGTFDQWNDDQPAQTTITTLVRRSLALDVGGFVPNPYPDTETEHPHAIGEPCGDDCVTIDGQRAGEDWDFTLRCRAAGAVFRHAPEVTWTWHHHESNTSGLPDRW